MVRLHFRDRIRGFCLSKGRAVSGSWLGISELRGHPGTPDIKVRKALNIHVHSELQEGGRNTVGQRLSVQSQAPRPGW